MCRVLIIALLIASCVMGVAGCSRLPDEGKLRASNVFADAKVVAFAEAIRGGDFPTAEQLLREGVNINTIGKQGVTPLTWTLLKQNKPGFRWLLDHGADPNLVPEDDKGTLFWASGIEDSEWLEMLLAHKADPNLKRRGSVFTVEVPLNEVNLYHRRKNLELLIKAGADVNFHRPKEEGGGTVVIDAAFGGWFEGVYILLEAGADHRPRTVGGDDVTYAVVGRLVDPGSDEANWREKVLKVLESRGADVEAARKKVAAEELENRKSRP